MTDPATELRDLVTQLAHTHEVPLVQYGQRIGHRRQKPLLTQLVEATVPTISSTGRGAGFNSRIAFDPAASDLYQQIRARIRSWAIDAGIPRHWTLATGQPLDWRDATQLLTAWHARTLHTDPARWTLTLHTWVTSINTLITDPPHRETLRGETCPTCGQTRASNSDGEQIDALAVTLHDFPTDITVDCRSCGAQWAGITGAEHLAATLTAAS